MTFSGARVLVAAGLVAVLAACATPQEPTAQITSAPEPPAQVDVAFITDPKTGQMDGPFDPLTGQRLMTVTGEDGQARILIDPATLKPVPATDQVPVVTGRPIMAKAPAFRMTRAARGGRLTVDPSAVTFAAAPASGFGLQVGAYWDKADAPVGWAVMASFNPELKSATPYLVEVKNQRGQTFYRVMATGFASLKDAQDACRKMQSRNEQCFTVKI